MLKKSIFTVPIDPDANAWARAVVTAGGTVSGGRQQLIARLIKGLKSDGIWPLLDRLWLLAGENSTQALTDLKSRASATAINSPTFTANRGYASNGTTSYIDSGFTPSTDGVNYTQNAASLFTYSNTTRSAGDFASIGIRLTATSNSSIIPFFTGSIAGGNANGTDSTANTGSVSDPLGLTLVVRNGASSQLAFRRGVQIGSSSVASASLQAQKFYILGRSGSGAALETPDTSRIAIAGIAGDLSGRAAALNARIERYLQSIGANA